MSVVHDMTIADAANAVHTSCGCRSADGSEETEARRLPLLCPGMTRSPRVEETSLKVQESVFGEVLRRRRRRRFLASWLSIKIRRRDCHCNHFFPPQASKEHSSYAAPYHLDDPDQEVHGAMTPIHEVLQRKKRSRRA